MRIPLLSKEDRIKFKSIYIPSLDMVGVSLNQLAKRIGTTAASTGNWYNKDNKYPKADKYISLGYFFLTEVSLSKELQKEWRTVLRRYYRIEYEVYSNTLKDYLLRNKIVEKDILDSVKIEDIVNLDIDISLESIDSLISFSNDRTEKNFDTSVISDIENGIESLFDDFTFLPQSNTAVSLENLNNQISKEKIKFLTNKLNTTQIDVLLEVISNFAFLNSEADLLSRTLNSDEISAESGDFEDKLYYLVHAKKLNDYLSKLLNLDTVLASNTLYDLPSMLENPDNFVK